jgi:biotin carboxyl carrier protein
MDGGHAPFEHETLEIQAPMNGRITALHVHVGKSVDEGEVMISIEAMKMETHLHAPRPGVVIEVRTTEDSIVHSGEVLAVID